MAVTAQKPDLLAHRRSVAATPSEVVSELARILGKKLTAYIAGVKDTRTVDGWATGSDPIRKFDEPRLRLALQVALMISSVDDVRVTQSWFMGLNPELDDRAPARLLREGDIAIVGVEVIGAARTYLANG